MLRIKKEIDLKELEKFGFKNTKNDTYYKSEPNDDYERFETNIVINPIGNFEKNEIIFEIVDLDNSEEISNIDIGARLDALYDLITAGYVEKVEEE